MPYNYNINENPILDIEEYDYEEDDSVTTDYIDGFVDGYSQGYKDGSDEGYGEGYEDGWDDCEDTCDDDWY